MPRASIDYMNARREHMHARSGGSKQSRRVEYAPDSQADAADLARNIIGEFSLWAELSRQQLVARLAIPQVDETEIPF
jgi:hypothetical protein